MTVHSVLPADEAAPLGKSEDAVKLKSTLPESVVPQQQPPVMGPPEELPYK